MEHLGANKTSISSWIGNLAKHRKEMKDEFMEEKKCLE
jgi:hypothetical protein